MRIPEAPHAREPSPEKPANVGIDDEELGEAIARLRPRYQRMLENLAK